MVLLHTLRQEVESSSQFHLADSELSNGPVSASPTLCRLLPQLRQYSSWLLSNLVSLLSQTDEHVLVYQEEMWHAYVRCLNSLKKLGNAKIVDLAYLLEEDQDTIGFTAFSESVRKWRFMAADGLVKPASTEEGITRSKPEDEMLYRIQSLLRDGIRLCRDSVSPCPLAIVFPNVL